MAIPQEKALTDFANKDTPKMKVRKSPVPQSYERITAGALRLSLEEMITLRSKLGDAIQTKLEERKVKREQEQADFERITNLLNGEKND